MVILSQIRGQTRAVAFLHRAMEAGRVAHAYLFCGPAGCGKYTTSLALAAALNCTRAPGQGCGECDSCSKIAGGFHPDVQTLERQGAARIIPIETIRTRVIPQLGMPPHEGRARLFLIEEATSLQGASANALLKTLEEPPRSTHFILCTTSPESLLPTIRSRCQRVNFAALPPDMRAELDQDTDTAERLSASVQSLRDAVAARDVGSLHRAAADAASDKDSLGPVLELLAQRLYQDARHAAMEHQLDRAATLGHQASIALRTRTAIEHYAHAQLALEAMLHDMRVSM